MNIVLLYITIVTTKPRHIFSSVNKNQIYSTYPMFIYVELAFGGHCLHFQVYTINSVIYIYIKKTITRYFDISLIHIIKIISVAKLHKRNYPIWNTQNSNNSCEYKFLLSDGLSLLMNKLSFNSNKYLLDSLPRNLKSSCNTLWSQTKHVTSNTGR